MSHWDQWRKQIRFDASNFAVRKHGIGLGRTAKLTAVHWTPCGGPDGDFRIRLRAPELGVLYCKTAP
jgi:hypothetical protein